MRSRRDTASPLRVALRVLGTALLCAALLATPGFAQETADPAAPGGWVELSKWGGYLQAGANTTFDVLVLRPLAIARLTLGAVFFVPAAALSAADRGAFREARDLFITEPYEDAFDRPLGKL